MTATDPPAPVAEPDVSTSHAKAQLAAALRSDGVLAALAALRWASDWVGHAMPHAVAAGSAEPARGGTSLPIEAVVALDDALTAAQPLIEQIPDLLTAAHAGPQLTDHLRDRQTALERTRIRTNENRGTLLRLRAVERDLRDKVEEHDDLRAQVSELRRLERLADALDQLADQREVLHQRSAALVAKTDPVTDGVATAAGTTVTLTDEVLASLREDHRAVLVRTRTVQDRLADLTRRVSVIRADLAEQEQLYEQLAAEREQTVAALCAYAEADRIIADVLAAVPREPHDGQASRPETPDLEHVRALAGDCSSRLHEVDQALQRALAARQRDAEVAHRMLPWNR